MKLGDFFLDPNPNIVLMIGMVGIEDACLLYLCDGIVAHLS